MSKCIANSLAEPFDLKDVEFKPQVVKDNRALALAYVDARAIMDRLDQVVGVENWQDNYQLLTDNSVVCRLRVRFGDRWIAKTDVGSPSAQPDGGDRPKAAFSDALKRTAVKFGVGRYLYRLPALWVDYDPVKKQFASTPRLPDWAMPKKSVAKPAVPASGAELHRRLREADSELASKGLCPVGALLGHIAQAGVKAGFAPDLSNWTGPAIELAVAETRLFKSHLGSNPETRTAA